MAVWIPSWDLRCEKCSDGQKAFNGCEGDSSIPERWKIREWSWQRCPVRLITTQTISFIQAYNFIKYGILPHNRGYLRESNRLIEAIEVIEAEVRKIEADNLRRVKK